jgi:hypothetical protein
MFGLGVESVLEWLRPEQFRYRAGELNLWPIAWRREDGMPRGPRNLIEMAYRLLQHRQGAGWEFWFGTPDRVADWHVYGYEYIDELDFMPPAAELFCGWELGDLLLAAVGERLRGIGWDGEGVIQMFWLPPFLGVGMADYGCYGLMVKQDNDGISWLACPVPLPWVDAVKFTSHPIYEEFLRRGVAEGRLRIEGSDEG